MKKENIYIIRKIIKAKSTIDAINKEKRFHPDEIILVVEIQNEKKTISPFYWI